MPHAFVYPALALCAGALLAIGFNLSALACAAGLIGSVLLSIVALKRTCPALVLAASCAGWCCGGGALASVADARARDPPLGRVLAGLVTGDGEVVTCVGSIAADATSTPAGVSLRVSVSALERAGLVRPASGGVSLTVIGADAARSVPKWTAGRAVRVSARLHVPAGYRDPGVPDMALALARRGIALTGTVKSGALVEVTSGSRVQEAAAAWRASVRRLVNASVGAWNARSAAIVLAVLLGDRAGLDDEDERRMQEAGTYHVIAISGGNIAILTGLLLAIGRVTGAGWRVQYLGAAGVLVLYALTIDGGSSVTRATVMAVTYLVARSLDHESSAETALAVAAAVTVCASPLAVVEPGFLLTFGATIALVVWAGEAAGRAWQGPRILRYGLELLVASIAVEAVLLPIAAWFFYRVTIAGLLLNFAAIPLMGVVQMGGMAAAAVAALHLPSGVIAGWVPHQAAQLLVGSSALVAWWPWLTWRIPPPMPWVVVAYYAALVALASRRLWGGERGLLGRRVPALAWGGRALVRPPAIVFGIALTLLGWIALVPHASIGRPGVGMLRVTVLDVGQGDATLVQLPGGRATLVDAGGAGPLSRFDIGERVIAPALWALGVRRLDAVVVSHGDRDHAGGVPAVAAIFSPHEIWEGVAVPRDEARAELAAQADLQRIAWRTVRPGDARRDGRVTITVWHPPEPEWERQKVRNEDSIVMEIRYGQVSIVLPGDIGLATESLLLRIPRAPLRVLKVPHHGSAGSSSLSFLRALDPHVALVSCGIGNRFGHPAPPVLDRLASIGASVYRTDRQGAITVETDGRRLRVTPFLPEPGVLVDMPGPGRGRTLEKAVRTWMTRTQAMRRRP